MNRQNLSRTYRGLVFLIFLIVVLCGTNVTPARAAPKTTAARKVRVEDLLRVQFKRAPGDVYGKAVLDTGGPQSWYSAYASSSTVDFDGELYNTIYKKGWALFAAASSDGFHWQPAYDGEPVLSDPPAGNFDTAGPGSNYSVHPTKMLIQNGRVRVWYTGEDSLPPHYQRTGLMEAVLP